MTEKIKNPFELVSFASRDDDSREQAEILSRNNEEVNQKIEAATVSLAGTPQVVVTEEKADKSEKPKKIKYFYFRLPNDEKRYLTFADGITAKRYTVAKEIVRELDDQSGSIALHLFVYE